MANVNVNPTVVPQANISQGKNFFNAANDF